jgi:diacylglycerol kinase (ATP)
MSPMSETSRIVVAINPRASFGATAQVGGQVVEALAAAGYAVDSCQAADYASLTSQVRDAVARPALALVVVGGDGMAHLGAQLALEAGIPLGLIPSGTGNDLARHLGIPLGSPTEAISLLVAALTTPPRLIDVGMSRGPSGTQTPYVCVLSAGFDALVNERANALRFPKGRHRYTVPLLLELAKLRALDYTVSIDGEDFSGRYLLVAVANSQSFGGGMKVTPEAVIDDGVLDVFLLKPLSRLNFLRIYPRVFKGTHVRDPRVIIRQGRTVHIDCEGVIAYADGERMSELPLEITVSHRALRVLA